MTNSSKALQIKALGAAAVLAAVAVTAAAAPKTSAFHWETVVNNNDFVPGSDRYFNSYNQPSVNSRGMVVFRARSTGHAQGPLSGIFRRDVSGRDRAIQTIASRSTVVPGPNNTCYPQGGGQDATDCPPEGSGQFSTFNEFPSFPRVALNRDFAATRGNSQPVWTYTPEGGSETRVGTSGVYLHTDGNQLLPGATQLGSVPGYCIYQVPGIDALGTRFDQFPGAPAVTDNGVVVFKGNYADNGVASTGVFFRDVLAGDVPVQLIAHSVTNIPGSDTPFGSTAPPSAAEGRVVFVGVDNEELPSEGGIYLAPLSENPELTVLAAIGDPVPGVQGQNYSRFGEGLSFDGRFVSFWATWGGASNTLRLYCPEEGNRDRRDFCNNRGMFADGSGDANSICNDTTDDSDSCYQVLQVPANQGIFVHDTRTGETVQVARTGDVYDDFLYWNYSGAPPGGSHGGGHGESGDDREPPRWRSSAFAAVTSNGSARWVVWKARNGVIGVNDQYENPVDGIYLHKSPGRGSVTTVVDTQTPGTVLDREAPAGSVVTEIGLERDGMRSSLLVINASMTVPPAEGAVQQAEEEEGHEDEDMAGIYLTRVR